MEESDKDVPLESPQFDYFETFLGTLQCTETG